jgi:hypothetical protein
MMRCILAVPTVLVALPLLIFSAQNSFAQHPKGIVLCIAGCSKSDKGCQDRCVPSRLKSDAKACIETCRQRAAEPDLIVEMSRCVSACLGTPTQ